MMLGVNERRSKVRDSKLNPKEVFIEIENKVTEKKQVYNVREHSEFGLSFYSDKEINLNSPLKFKLIIQDKQKELCGKTVHSFKDNNDLYVVGMKINDEIKNKYDISFLNFKGLLDELNEKDKIKVKDFFNKDVKKFDEDLFDLFKKVKAGNLKSEEVEDKYTVLTNEILIKGDALENDLCNEKYMKKVKKVFREITYPWFYQGPIMKMGYEKWRGYPGDYKLFEILYENKSLTEDKKSIEYYSDRYFLNNAYTKAVRTRKNKMKNILEDFLVNTNSSCVRLLNVACGPSREIRELLYDPILASKTNLVFTGLDNDEQSLEFSKSKFNNVSKNIEIRLLHANVLNIFRDIQYYDIIGKQDIIYILGLTEYLPDRIFKNLINFLAKLLNDKGRLVITYKDKDIRFPSLPPDWLCDWTFIKRSKEDLIKAAKSLGEDKFSLQIEREGTGSIFFLILTKK